MAGKGDPRAAAERLERGIERYAGGELAAAALEFEGALELCPGHERARAYLAWVRDVLQGKRGVNGKKSPTIDEDALRAVTEALDLDEAPPATRAPSVDDAGREPTPLTPSQAKARPISPQETQQITAPPQSHPTQTHTPIQGEKKISSPTILGVSPPPLAPITRVAAGEDRPDSVTREWGRGTPTGQNLPPLEVPELTEDQIAELISLEPSPLGEVRAQDPGSPLIEFEAEHTPEPRRAPAALRSVSETQPITSRRRDDSTVDDLVLPPLGNPDALDPLEIEPTRSRATPPPPAASFAELTPPPPLPGAALPGLASLEARGDESRDEDPSTNPFVQAKLREHSYDNPLDDDDEPSLPRAPDFPSLESAAERFESARRAFDEGELESALEIVESVVVESGGIEAESCRPHLALLEKVYRHVVGPLDRVPRFGEGRPDLDPRAAFLLSRVDTQMSAEDLLEVSGMPRLEALRLLALLIQYGAVVLEGE